MAVDKTWQWTRHGSGHGSACDGSVCLFGAVNVAHGHGRAIVLLDDDAGLANRGVELGVHLMQPGSQWVSVC